MSPKKIAPVDIVTILRTEAQNQRTPPIDYVIAEDGGRMVHRPEPDIAMAELLEEAASALATLEAKIAEKDKEIAELREAVEPFSRLASVLCVGDADDAIVIGVSAGDLRRLVNARRASEGGKIDRAAPRCEHCAGLGRVFVCRHWPRCRCTEGAIENDCPGHSVTCPECGGKGNTRLVASTSTTNI